jgi:hypothetical protein
MLQFVEKKMNSTMYTLFFIGLISVGLGVVTLLSDFFVRLFIGLLFFLVAYVTLHLAYRIQVIKDEMGGVFEFGAQKKNGTAKKK